MNRVQGSQQKLLRPSLFFALIAAALSAVTISHAETSQIYDIGDVLVRGRSQGVNAVTVVKTVDAEDIRDSGARDVVEAVHLMPGIEISTGGSGVARMNIRGFRTRHVLLLLDGIPLNSAYDQQFDASLIPVEHIEKIEMTLGPNSVLYGQGGIGGVVNIITKKGSREPSGMMGFQAGDGNSYVGKASLSAGNQKTSILITANHYTRDWYPLSDDFEATYHEDGGGRENSHKEVNYVFGNIRHKVSRDLDMGLTFSYVKGKYGIPWGVIDDTINEFAPNSKYERIDELEGHSVQISGDYSPNTLFHVRSWIFINKMTEHDSRYKSKDFVETENIFFDTCEYRLKDTASIRGGSIQPSFDLGEIGTLTFGFSLEQDQWHETGIINGGILSAFPPPVKLNILYPDERQEFNIYSYSAEYQLYPFDNLGLTFGYALYSHDRQDHEDEDESILFGAHLDVSDQIRIKASYQRNIRFPSIRQLYDPDAGNPALKTEKVYHYTAGIDLSLPKRSSISLNAFHSIAKNFIEKDKYDGIFQNFDKYLFRGAEISAETRILSRTHLSGSYSYLYAHDLSNTGKDELQYRPSHRYSLQAKYDFPFGLTLYSSALWVKEQYYYARRGTDLTRKKRLNDYSVINLRLTQKFMKNSLELYVGADNLLDENYEQSYGFPQPGRVFYGGIAKHF